MPNQLIFHIARNEDWERAKKEGSYKTDSLHRENFIHCSTKGQLTDTANLLFWNQPNLLLLVIEPLKVEHEIVYENTDGGTRQFPHIYGPLNLNAVAEVVDFKPDADGNFHLPAKYA